MNFSPKLTRRTLIMGLSAFPVVAFAHAGHGAARVSADAKVLSAKQSWMRLKITILNLGSTPIVLHGLSASGASATPLPAPFEIGGFDGADVVFELTFQSVVPSAFTAQLDFAEHGSAPVLVAR